MSKTPNDDFEWTDLIGKNIIGGRPGGVPAMTLQYVIEEAGMSLSDMNFITNVDFNNIAAAFDGDASIDYCTMFEPVASAFKKEGKGHIVASVGEAGGDIPFTAFSASRSFVQNNKLVLADFLKAIVKGYNFLMNNIETDIDAVVAALRPSFADSDDVLIKESVRNYMEINAWSPTPVMSEASFNRLQTVMERAGKLISRADYSVAVDNSIANSIL